MRVEIRNTIDPPWTAINPIRFGAVPAGFGSPDIYVTVETESRPLMRVDIYSPGDESRFFQEATVWRELLAIGYGERVYLVNLPTRRESELELEEYFGSFYSTVSCLLIASASHITRLGPDGRIVWRSDEVAIDGVNIDRVLNGVIYGKGEWDPPDRWKEFTLSLESGRAV